MFEIIKDRLQIDGRPAAFEPAQWPQDWTNKRIEPLVIVLHDTAGRLTPGNSKDYLRRNDRKVSVHFVVERDGTVTQLIDCDCRANHCDPAEWQGRRSVNGFSIGIEIVNPGGLVGTVDKATAWFGQSWAAGDGVVAVADDEHASKLWLAYTEAQLASVEQLVGAIGRAYPSIVDVVGHFHIAPKRKEDPTPLMPWPRMKAALGARRAPAPVHDTAEVQNRLNELGYFVGKVDGLMGPRTREKLRTFQEQNGLPIGGFDQATDDALFSDDAKPMPTGTRSELTVADLKAAGSTTVAATQTVKRSSEVTGALFVGEAAFQAIQGASAAVAQVQGGLQAVHQTRGVIETAIALLPFLATPKGISTLVILGLLAVVWWQAHRVEQARLDDAKSGANVGR